MSSKNYYDVTKWNVGNPYEDIGEVINSIIADIKKRQLRKIIIHNCLLSSMVQCLPASDYHNQNTSHPAY